jgi:hypothetical protein
MSKWYVISDIEEFIKTARKLVFSSFGENGDGAEGLEKELINMSPDNMKEMDLILGQDESRHIVLSVVKKQKNKTTKEERYLINDDLMTEVIESLNDRMVSNILNSLVNRGVLESAYDSESNDFVFWIKDNNEKEDNQKPETD